MVVDIKGRQIVNLMPSGVVGFISWGRLVEQLRKADEFNPDETITHMSADLTGISFRVEKN